MARPKKGGSLAEERLNPGSLIEEVSMSPCSFKADLFTFELVDQYPVRFDMGIPEGPPLALKRMIPIRNRQWQSFNEQIQQGSQLLHVFASLLHLPYIPLELT